VEGGRLVLTKVAYQGREQVVKLLIDKGANVNAQGGTYGSALTTASHIGHKPVVKLLLETNQIDVNLEDKDGQTPLLFATQNGHEA
jgi:ankyrin repeat protein